MLKKSLLAALFVAAFLVSSHFVQKQDSMAGLSWGPTLDVAQARGK